MNEIESIDRRNHPAKVILNRIKHWFFNLIWPEVIYGFNREPNDWFNDQLVGDENEQ